MAEATEAPAAGREHAGRLAAGHAVDQAGAAQAGQLRRSICEVEAGGAVEIGCRRRHGAGAAASEADGAERLHSGGRRLDLLHYY